MRTIFHSVQLEILDKFSMRALDMRVVRVNTIQFTIDNSSRRIQMLHVWCMEDDASGNSAVRCRW